MALREVLRTRASRLADDVQRSLRRTRLEGERRLLQRQQRAALERLGERAWALVRAGTLSGADLGPQLGALEEALGRIDENRREFATLAPEGGPTAATDRPTSSPGPGWEAAERFFK
jgi:hypothetical protein